MIADELVKKYPIISDQIDMCELRTLLRELEKVLFKKPKSSIVEFGCYAGTTSLFIRRLLDAYGFGGEFHVYDSFLGLPPKTQKDESVVGGQFKAGELSSSRKNFVQNFKKSGLKLPVIHKNWFCNFSENDIPDEICFAFFDGDFYESIRDSFRLCEKKFIKSATIVVDDFDNDALPGAAAATKEWLEKNPAKIHVEKSLAIIYTN